MRKLIVAVATCVALILVPGPAHAETIYKQAAAMSQTNPDGFVYVWTDGELVELLWMTADASIDLRIPLPEDARHHQRGVRRAILRFSLDDVCLVSSYGDGDCVDTGEVEVRVRWESYGQAVAWTDGDRSRNAHVTGALTFDGELLLASSFTDGGGTLRRTITP
jgi:hypothetical protein